MPRLDGRAAPKVARHGDRIRRRRGERRAAKRAMRVSALGDTRKKPLQAAADIGIL
jgi:hypothetical protein